MFNQSRAIFKENPTPPAFFHCSVNSSVKSVKGGPFTPQFSFTMMFLKVF